VPPGAPTHSTIVYIGAMARRTYENGRIRILWDSSVCIHTGLCLKLGEGVFDTRRRPWVDMSLASDDTIISTIETCPSGALRYERIDGGEGEQPDVPTTIVPWPNGPLMVRGEIEVKDRHGETFVAAPRAALCRCGSSQNQPFCDLSHRDAGFQDYPRVTPPEREAATSPIDVSTTPLA
jgi:uncharacterized Fe-S cluster protein YjdI/CDGSH-type Zn-finger protein